MTSKNYKLLDFFIRSKLAERATVEDPSDWLTKDDTGPGVYFLYHPKTGEFYIGAALNLYESAEENRKAVIEGNHWEENVRQAYLRMPCDSPVFLFERMPTFMEVSEIVLLLLAAGDGHPKLLNTTPFSVAFHNPLEKENIRMSVTEALLNQRLIPMTQLGPFYGGGIYAIYYTGNFPAYTRGLSGVPLHVGKATPPASQYAVHEVTSQALYKRLREHIESINQAENLDIKDFHCRILRVDDFWTQEAVKKLIERFSPIWNTIADGFGNHDPGGGRYVGVCSRWDVLHPGRPWASKCRPNDASADDIIQDIYNHLKIEY